MIFSSNMLKTYKLCPQKYKFKYEDNFTPPQNAEIFEKGKKIHALAHYYLLGTDISKFEQSLSAKEKILWERLKTNKYFNLKTFGTEYELNCKAGKYWIGGRLDAVVYDDDENYYILDYKTGAVPAEPEKDLQTIVYMCALAAHLKNFKSMKFVYLDLRNNTEKVIDSKQINPAIVENILKQIEMKKFAPQTDKKVCENCEYKMFC
ncbi:PD-(D/E)XK nuclease family protein [bacterium]|nr:PD-(D/E)XK nuclease family protein [bacterium]